MCSENVYRRKEKDLSGIQKYKVNSMFFVVQPVFKEDSAKTLGKALISLMNDEISKL